MSEQSRRYRYGPSSGHRYVRVVEDRPIDPDARVVLEAERARIVGEWLRRQPADASEQPVAQRQALVEAERRRLIEEWRRRHGESA